MWTMLIRWCVAYDLSSLPSNIFRLIDDDGVGIWVAIHVSTRIAGVDTITPQTGATYGCRPTSVCGHGLRPRLNAGPYLRRTAPLRLQMRGLRRLPSTVVCVCVCVCACDRFHSRWCLRLRHRATVLCLDGRKETTTNWWWRCSPPFRRCIRVPPSACSPSRASWVVQTPYCFVGVPEPPANFKMQQKVLQLFLGILFIYYAIWQQHVLNNEFQGWHWILNHWKSPRVIFL